MEKTRMIYHETHERHEKGKGLGGRKKNDRWRVLE